MDIIVGLSRHKTLGQHLSLFESLVNQGPVLYPVPKLPIKANVGDKCYIFHRGNVHGYFVISGLIPMVDIDIGEKTITSPALAFNERFNYVDIFYFNVKICFGGFRYIEV